MNQEIIARAGALINSKANYIGGGMEGHCVLALTDENGYPTASTLTIAKTDGINWLTFATSPDSNKAKRIAMCNRASVCLSSSEYNITLVGTVEVVTDPGIKKDTWFEPMSHMWSGPEDPNFYVLRFNTERYNLFFADDGSEAAGTLTASKQSAMPEVVPTLSFNGQCSQAIELYEKAFGAILVSKMLYSESDPADMDVIKEEEKDFIGYAEIAIGNTLIAMGDDADVTASGNPNTSLMVLFSTEDELNAAYKIISEGATIIFPMCSQSYCTAYVVLIDKFGVRWDLMSGYEG